MNPVAGGTAPVGTHPADRFIAPDSASVGSGLTAPAENQNGIRGEPDTEEAVTGRPSRACRVPLTVRAATASQVEHLADTGDIVGWDLRQAR